MHRAQTSFGLNKRKNTRIFQLPTALSLRMSPTLRYLIWFSLESVDRRFKILLLDILTEQLDFTASITNAT